MEHTTDNIFELTGCEYTTCADNRLLCGMEFGHLPEEELAAVDFTLPANAAGTLKTLASAKAGDDFRIYAGCSKWGYRSWSGSLFPGPTKEQDFLSAYVRQFDQSYNP